MPVRRADAPRMRRRNASRLSTLLAAGAAALLGGLALPAGAHALALDCLVPAGHSAGDAASRGPLRFGIYPGGPAGSVDPKAPPRPENPSKRLAALQALRGSSPFVVRLYSAWTGDAAADDVSGWLDSEIAGYTAAGLQVELAVRYKPATGAGPAEFAEYVRGIVRRYGADPGFVSLQVANEANLPGAPGASDGAFAGAAEAVVKGVVAAKDQARQEGRGLRVGFNWGYDERPLAAGDFWATLGRLGGRAFAEAVDWVGLDTYPGTWSPQLAITSLLPGLAGGAVKESVRALRDCFMPMAGLGGATSIHIAENGFPTGPGRSEELQAQVLEQMVRSVVAIRDTYGVSDYRWFDLRDSASADPSIESQYGITRDDYAPKPAFATYRDLIAGHGGAGADAASAPAADCRRSPVKVVVPRWKSKRAGTLVVQVGKKVVKRLRRKTMPRSVRISLRSGRATVRLRYSTRSASRRISRSARSSYRVC